MKRSILTSILVSSIILNNFNKSYGDHKIYFYDTDKPITANNNVFKQPKDPIQVSMTFLKWYVKNREILRKKHHFYNIDTTGDTTKMYSINMTNVKNYTAALYNSGLVSKYFLQNIQTRYVNAKNYLATHPQNDGPVVDFEETFTINYDLDPVIQIMEEDELTENFKYIQAGKMIIEKKFSVVTIKVNSYLSYVFILSKKNAQWLIDSITPVA